MMRGCLDSLDAVFKQLDELLVHNIFCFPHDNKFMRNYQLGKVLYIKPVNLNVFEHKKPQYNQRIASMRVLTHTKK